MSGGRKPRPRDDSTFVLTDDERRILVEASVIQAERAERPLAPLPPNPEHAERWHAIADAFRVGRPVGYVPPAQGVD